MRGDLWQKGGCLVVGVGGNPVYMQYTQVIYTYINIHAVLRYPCIHAVHSGNIYINIHAVLR